MIIRRAQPSLGRPRQKETEREGRACEMRSSVVVNGIAGSARCSRPSANERGAPKILAAKNLHQYKNRI